MARYDKYDPISGGFRARLAANLSLTDGSIIAAVSLDSSGKVVVGDGGQTGFVGVLVKNASTEPVGRMASSIPGTNYVTHAPVGCKAGDVVDIMTAGEIVDLDTGDFPAGTNIYAGSDGTLSDDTDGTLVGWTVDAGRLVVRFAG